MWWPCSWQEALARANHLKVLPGCDLALTMGVPLIYIADRVLDGFIATPGPIVESAPCLLQNGIVSG